MIDAPVLVDREDAVATVTLNQPDRHNALTAGAKNALVEALRADPATAVATVARHYTPIVTALTTMPKPVVAAVNGTCVGDGLGFALAYDLRVFAAGATLGTAFSAIGVTCDSGLARTLPRAVGAARAREPVLLGHTFTPEDGVSWGMTGEIVPAGDVLATAAATAARLAAETDLRLRRAQATADRRPRPDPGRNTQRGGDRPGAVQPDAGPRRRRDRVPLQDEAHLPRTVSPQP